MESFMKIFDSLVARSGENNEKIQASKQNNLLIAGPSKSGRSSLLFEMAFLYAEAGKSVVFISPNKINSLPMLFANREQPSAKILSRINIIYLAGKNQIVEFMASVHLNYKEQIDLIIVDDIDHYYLRVDKRNQLISQAKVISFVADAVHYLNTLGKHHSSKSHCNLICTVSTQDDGKMPANQKEILEYWFQDMIMVKQQKDSKHGFSAVMERDGHKSEQLSFNYAFEDHKIVASEIEGTKTLDCI